MCAAICGANAIIATLRAHDAFVILGLGAPGAKVVTGFASKGAPE
jgi:hypothetical protein